MCYYVCACVCDFFKGIESKLVSDSISFANNRKPSFLSSSDFCQAGYPCLLNFTDYPDYFLIPPIYRHRLQQYRRCNCAYLNQTRSKSTNDLKDLIVLWDNNNNNFGFSSSLVDEDDDVVVDGVDDDGCCFMRSIDNLVRTRLGNHPVVVSKDKDYFAMANSTSSSQ